MNQLHGKRNTIEMFKIIKFRIVVCSCVLNKKIISKSFYIRTKIAVDESFLYKFTVNNKFSFYLPFSSFR